MRKKKDPLKGVEVAKLNTTKGIVYQPKKWGKQPKEKGLRFKNA